MTLTRFTSLIILIFLAIGSLLLSLFKGSTSISFNHIFSLTDPSLSHSILFDIRLPRSLCAFVTGGLLALAGAFMQTLLRNPLADPYVLGTSGGAAVATLLLMFCGITGFALTLGSWLGSLVAILFVYGLSQKQHSFNTENLILTGIALASGFSAIISLILFISPDHVLRGMLFWLIGDLSETQIPVLGGSVLLLGIFSGVVLGKELNILIRGEKEATALGVNVSRLKIQLFLLSSALTATAVTLAGCIGFVGLIVPHVFRLLFGYEHRLLLPGCALLGGSLLTIADMLARTLFAPQQLPVGIMMALIGIPIFIFLLHKPLTK